ncbi:MAG: hypothetical protein A2284_00650 [Deltaproteobacteria bacterium RIFOXYA12_FULL_61_11]|nr:MAG: hypothetical protein A2284_00650 [Deltaproteobacteria bacterium RIFOXYA12_FULL_61_11]
MSNPKKNVAAAPPEALFGRIVSILEQAQGNVVRAVNTNMVLAYWLIGREIVQELQGGEERAEYGKKVVEDLSARLTERYGKGFSPTTLQYFRRFYLAYPDRCAGISRPAGVESAAPMIEQEISRPAGAELAEAGNLSPAGTTVPQGFSPHLSWSHYRALMRVENEHLKTGTRPPFPYSDVRLLPYLQHSFRFLPNVAACHARDNLLAEKHNTFWHAYEVIVAACAQGHRERLRDQDHHAVVRQAHDRRDRAAVVLHPDAPQSQVARDILPGRVSGAVALVHQEPQWRQPERRGNPQARLLRVRLRAHPRASTALGVRDRAFTKRA